MRASFLTSPAESFAAGVDARIKLGLCAAGSLCIIFFSSPLSLGVLLAGALAFGISAAKMPTIARVVLFATFMNCLTLAFTGLMALAVPGMMRWDIVSLSVPYLRMLVIVLLLMALALSTPVQVITGKLQWFKLPGFIYIPLSIAIRFIPSFMADCRQIRDAARLRPGSGILSFFRGIMVPLLFRVLSSADELAVAAELKGVHALGKAVLPKTPSLGRRDAIVLVFACLAVLTALALQFWGPSFAKAVY